MWSVEPGKAGSVFGALGSGAVMLVDVVSPGSGLGATDPGEVHTSAVTGLEGEQGSKLFSERQREHMN